MKVLENDITHGDSIGGQPLERGNSNEKIANLISFYTEKAHSCGMYEVD